VGLLLGFWFQANSIVADKRTRYWSSLAFGISSLFPNRTWKSISDASFTMFVFEKKKKKIFYHFFEEKKKEEKRENTMSPRSFSWHHFPKNNGIRINISFNFIFNWNISHIWCYSSKYFWCCISWWKSFDINYLLGLDLIIIIALIWANISRKKKKKERKVEKKLKKKKNLGFRLLNSCQTKITNNCIQFTFVIF